MKKIQITLTEKQLLTLGKILDNCQDKKTLGINLSEQISVFLGYYEPSEYLKPITCKKNKIKIDSLNNQ